MFGDNSTYIILGAIAVLLLAGLAIAASLKKPVYKRRGQLLLLNEQRFLTALLQALPPDTILTFKVRLLDIVSVSDKDTGKNLERDLADYCVDFVLVDRTTTNVVLCIEMDSDSKDAAERLARNTYISRALRRAGVPHLRLPLVRYYDAARLRQVIKESLSASANSQA